MARKCEELLLKKENHKACDQVAQLQDMLETLLPEKDQLEAEFQ